MSGLARSLVRDRAAARHSRRVPRAGRSRRRSPVFCPDFARQASRLSFSSLLDRPTPRRWRLPRTNSSNSERWSRSPSAASSKAFVSTPP